MVKDSINIYKNYEQIDLKCYCCDNKKHQINNCDLIHYKADKEKILKSYVFPDCQTERPNFERKMKKTKRISKKFNKKKFILDLSSNDTKELEEDEVNELSIERKKNISKTDKYLLTQKQFKKFSLSLRDSQFLFENNPIIPPSKNEKLFSTIKEIEKKLFNIQNSKIMNFDSDFCVQRNFQEYFPKNNLYNIVKSYNRINKKNIMHKSLFYTFNFKERINILNQTEFRKRINTLSSKDLTYSLNSKYVKKKDKRGMSLFAESKRKLFSKNMSVFNYDPTIFQR